MLKKSSHQAVKFEAKDKIGANDEEIMTRLRAMAERNPDMIFIKQIIIVMERAFRQRIEANRLLQRREDFIKRNIWK